VRTILAVLTVLLAVAPSAVADKRLPTLAGEIRPAMWGNGDGTEIMGGLDGTGRGDDFGHIRWTTWSSTEALGWGAAWDRCLNFRGRPCTYALKTRRLYLIKATRPVGDVFTHLVVGHSCWLFLGRRYGYAPVSCHTWRYP